MHWVCCCDISLMNHVSRLVVDQQRPIHWDSNMGSLRQVTLLLSIWYYSTAVVKRCGTPWKTKPFTARQQLLNATTTTPAKSWTMSETPVKSLNRHDLNSTLHTLEYYWIAKQWISVTDWGRKTLINIIIYKRTLTSTSWTPNRPLGTLSPSSLVSKNCSIFFNLSSLHAPARILGKMVDFEIDIKKVSWIPTHVEET